MNFFVQTSNSMVILRLVTSSPIGMSRSNIEQLLERWRSVGYPDFMDAKVRC